MFQTRSAPSGDGTKYYLEKFLREDFLEHGIILNTDSDSRLIGLSFNSHRLGTANIGSRRKALAFRWEDETTSQARSQMDRHYTTITGVHEEDQTFANQVIEDVLGGIGNGYLREILDDFKAFKDVRLDPDRLPKTSSPAAEPAEEPGRDTQRPQTTPNESSRVTLWAGLSLTRQQIYAVIGAVSITAVFGLILLTMNVQVLPGRYCDQQNGYCFRLQRSLEGIMFIGGYVNGDEFMDREFIEAVEAAPNFFVSVNWRGERRRCFARMREILVMSPCMLNESVYGEDFITVVGSGNNVKCHRQIDGENSQVPCYPQGEPASHWRLFQGED